MMSPTTRLLFGGVAYYPPGSSFGPRQAESFEFVWIIRGTAKIRYDRQEIAAPPATVLLCRPGMTDYYEWDRADPTAHAFFHFQFDARDPQWPPLDTWPLWRRMPQGDMLRPLFRQVLEFVDEQEPRRSFLAGPSIEAMLRAFVFGRLTLADPAERSLPRPVVAALMLMRERLERHPVEPLTLGILAAQAHVSPEHLCRMFSLSSGAGPLRCFRLMRLERAATLLARSNLSVKEIAHVTGFATPYHFSRAFREASGMSPRAFRREGDPALERTRFLPEAMSRTQWEEG